MAVKTNIIKGFKVGGGNRAIIVIVPVDWIQKGAIVAESATMVAILVPASLLATLVHVSNDEDAVKYMECEIHNMVLA